MRDSYDFVIVGAGISGLYLAHKLNQSKQDFLLIDKQAQVGGTWQSLNYRDSVYEFGPNTVMNTSDELMTLVEELGLEESLVRTSFKNSRRFFALRDRLVEVGSSPLEFFTTELLSWGAKLRIMLEPFVPAQRSQESVFDFAARRFGKEFAAGILDNALKGIWAGDSKKLEANSALAVLKDTEETHGSVLAALISKALIGSKQPRPKLETISCKAGLQSMAQAIAASLPSSSLLLGNEVQELKRDGQGFTLDCSDRTIKANQVLVATQAYAAARMLSRVDGELASLLAKIFYAPVFLCAFSINKSLFTKPKIFENSFGLINTNPDHFLLGTIVSSELFAARKLEDEYLFVSFLGGSRNAQILDFGERDLINVNFTEIKEILDPYALKPLTQADVKTVDSKLLAKAIPQYQLGHKDLVNKIEARLAELPGLELCGNYLKGVSIKDSLILVSNLYASTAKLLRL